MFGRILWDSEGRLALPLRMGGLIIAWFMAIELSGSMGMRAASAAGGPSLRLTLMYIAPYLAGTVIAAAWFRRYLDRRSWDGMALQAEWGRRRDAAFGLLTGALMAAAAYGVAAGLGWAEALPVTVGWAAALQSLGVFFLFHVPDGVCEELVFRGYLFQNSGEGAPIWRATLWVGLIFAALHLLKAGSLPEAAAILVAGMAVSWFLVTARLVTGSLWFPIGWHIAWNWASAHIFALGAADTGVFPDGLLVLKPVAAGYDVLVLLVEAALYLAGTGLLLLWAGLAGRPVNWRSRLPSGQPIAAPARRAANPVLSLPAVRLAILAVGSLLILLLARGVWAVNVLSFLLLLLLVWGAERRTLADVGLGRRGMGRSAGTGFLLGAAAMAAVVGIDAVADWYRVKAVAWSEPTTAVMLAAFLIQYFVVALGEEALFRGGLFRILEEWGGTWVALGANALLFGLLHRQGTLWDSLSVAVLGGVFYSVAYLRTRSLWFPIGIHWAWNFVQGPVLGLAVSGGQDASGVIGWGLVRPTMSGPAVWTGGRFGPEGGLVALLVCLAVTAVLLVGALRQGHVVAPSWSRRRSPVGPVGPRLSDDTETPSAV